MMKSMLYTALLLITLGGCQAANQSAPGSVANTPSQGGASNTTFEVASFANVEQILSTHCKRCHSRQGGLAEDGISFDSYSEIQRQVRRIQSSTVRGRSMPPGNSTRMQDAERALLGQWINDGAPQ